MAEKDLEKNNTSKISKFFKRKKNKAEEQEISVYETVEEAEPPQVSEVNEETPSEDLPPESTDSTLNEDGSSAIQQEESPEEATEPEDEVKPEDEVNIKESFLKKFKMPSIKPLPQKTMFIIAGVQIFLIIGLIAFAIIFTIIRKNSSYPAGTVFLTMPEVKQNSTNYIFTSREIEIDGYSTKLKGVLIDSQVSVFYFDRKIQVGCMDFSLSDSAGNVYYLDLAYHMNQEFTDRLYFQPFKEGITSFEMIVPKYVNTKTNSGKLYFSFDKELEIPTSYYVKNQNVAVEFEGVQALFKIDEAVFSSAGTFINYSFNSEDDRIKIVPDGKNRGFIRVNDNGSLVPALSGYALQEEARSTHIMSREAFRPLRSLSGDVSFTIKDLLCRVKINKTLETSELFLNKPEYEKEIRLAEYKMVLERMGKRGNTYVVVVHMEDLRLPVPTDEKDFSNRVLANYDMELIGKNREGETVTLKPQFFTSKNGADFVFKDEEKEIVYNSPNDVKLRINSAEIEMDDILFEFKLDELSEERDEQTQKALQEIVMLYEYDNRDLSAYTAQIVSSSISGDEIFAVVYEAGLDNEEAFYKKYAVSGVIRNGVVDILSEEEL